MADLIQTYEAVDECRICCLSMHVPIGDAHHLEQSPIDREVCLGCWIFSIEFQKWILRARDRTLWDLRTQEVLEQLLDQVDKGSSWRTGAEEVPNVFTGAIVEEIRDWNRKRNIEHAIAATLHPDLCDHGRVGPGDFCHDCRRQTFDPRSRPQLSRRDLVELLVAARNQISRSLGMYTYDNAGYNEAVQMMARIDAAIVIGPTAEPRGPLA